ncbi:MAG: hypothetical protein WDO73_06080 [Ignavibacteriota bacterium]
MTTTTSDNGAWLSASLATGAAPTQIAVTISAANLPNAGLTAGFFTGNLLLQK